MVKKEEISFGKYWET